MSVIYNATAYRKRCEPRPIDSLNKSVEDFMVGVYELANQHGIADVLLVTQANALLRPDLLEDDTKEQFVSACIHFGNEAHALEMAAYAHAFFRAELEKRLGYVKNHAEKRALGK
jgi:hypothetical protein